MHKVPKKGAAVFVPIKGDSRTVWIVPIGGSRCLHARFPGITCGGFKPFREAETIIMADKPVPQRPFAEDPYHLDEMMAERALRDAEKQGAA